MRAFVTGATGLLGNNLVRQLHSAGHQVTGLVRSREKARRVLGDIPINLIVGDVRSPETFGRVLHECDVVFHTAAYFREYFQPGNHGKALEETNVKATIELMQMADALGVRRFVHTSSSATIGPGPDGSASDENSAPPKIASENLYVRSKVEGDAKIRAFAPAHGMAVVEILPGWMWGPGDAGPTSAGRLALDFLARKLPGIPPGEISVVDARDVAAAMISAAERAPHGARYLVAGRHMTLAEIFSHLSRASGVPAPRARIPYVAAMAVAIASETWSRLTGKPATVTRQGIKILNGHNRVSSQRAERELGATFRPFAETARAVVDWYRSHPLPV